MFHWDIKVVLQFTKATPLQWSCILISFYRNNTRCNCGSCHFPNLLLFHFLLPIPSRAPCFSWPFFYQSPASFLPSEKKQVHDLRCNANSEIFSEISALAVRREIPNMKCSLGIRLLLPVCAGVLLSGWDQVELAKKSKYIAWPWNNLSLPPDYWFFSLTVPLLELHLQPDFLSSFLQSLRF